MIATDKNTIAHTPSAAVSSIAQGAEQGVNRLGYRVVLGLLREDQAVADLEHRKGEGENGPCREIRPDERNGYPPERAERRGTKRFRGFFQRWIALLKTGDRRPDNIGKSAKGIRDNDQ